MEKSCFIMTVGTLLLSACVSPPTPSTRLLETGLNLNAWQACQQQIRQCLNEGPWRATPCVDPLLKTSSNCQQLALLAKQLQVDPQQISINQLGPYHLVDAFFPADGQHRYYLLNSRGRLFSTALDPRQLDHDLAERYPSQNFLVLNDGPPVLAIRANGAKILKVALRIQDGCMACRTLARAELAFSVRQPHGAPERSVESFVLQPDNTRLDGHAGSTLTP